MLNSEKFSAQGITSKTQKHVMEKILKLPNMELKFESQIFENCEPFGKWQLLY